MMKTMMKTTMKTMIKMITVMKKDMDLARRIRGDKNRDHNDYQPKDGSENFVYLNQKY